MAVDVRIQMFACLKQVVLSTNTACHSVVARGHTCGSDSGLEASFYLTTTDT